VSRAWTDAEGLTSFDVLVDAPLKAVVKHCGRKYATPVSTSHELETVQVDRCRWGGPWWKRGRWPWRGWKKR
jgi:hypothetical protein